MKLSVIVPVLNSHEVVRRQLLHWSRMDLPESMEIIYVDDGSAPPLVNAIGVPQLRIVATNDRREWTWAVARNFGARVALGEYLLMTDIDYIVTRECIDSAMTLSHDKMCFKREFGVLDESGNLTQDIGTLKRYGLLESRIASKGVRMPPHPNNFVMRASVFWDLGGYPEDRVGMPYPQGEDRWFKAQWIKHQSRYSLSEHRPTLYMFPNGQFCGDVDYNPFGLFHGQSRKTDSNPWHLRGGSRG